MVCVKLLKNFFSKTLHSLFGSFYNILFLIGFISLGIGFVYVRMKGVEQDYELHRINKIFEKSSLHNKELKAEKALSLSAARIKKMAKDHNLKVPTSDQIIVIPE